MRVMRVMPEPHEIGGRACAVARGISWRDHAPHFAPPSGYATATFAPSKRRLMRYPVDGFDAEPLGQ